MINSYDEILNIRAADSLGRMLDFAVHSLRIDADQMMELFTGSGASALFERGDIRLICGMSGIELAYEVLEQSGLPYERVSPRHTISLSNEYWAGRAIAHAQWRTLYGFSRIINLIPASKLVSEFAALRYKLLDSLPLDISEQDKQNELRSLGENFISETLERIMAVLHGTEPEVSQPAQNDPLNAKSCLAGERSPICCGLKEIRTKNGLSQSQLAKAADIPLRTIQQYEQGQKDIRKARAEYIITLSAVLHCDPMSLLD